MKKSGHKGKRPAKRVTKDLPSREGRSVKGGVSNVLKTRHDTAKNSIGN
jgi:hypothetical protein